MSVSSMKKLAAYAHKEDLDLLVKKLMRLRCVDISSHEWSEDDDELGLSRVGSDVRRLELEASIEDISTVISALDPYVQKAKGFAGGKKRMNTDAFASDGRADAARAAVAGVLEIIKRREQIKGEVAEANTEISAARPYVNYELPLDFSGTDTTECFLGVLPAATDLDATGKELYRAGAIATLVGRDKNGIYAAYFCHKTDAAEVSSRLSSYGFLRASFS